MVRIEFRCLHFMEFADAASVPKDFEFCPVCLGTSPLPSPEDMRAGRFGKVDLPAQISSWVAAWMGHMHHLKVDHIDIPRRAMADILGKDKITVKTDEMGNVRVSLTKSDRRKS